MARSSRLSFRGHSIKGNRGFSLLELLVVLVIVVILSGLATYGFIGITNTFRISGTVGMVNSMIAGARQVAVNTRTERRVAIEMYQDPANEPTLRRDEIPVRIWVERKVFEFMDWPVAPFDEPGGIGLVENVSDGYRQLPESMRFTDISGMTVAAIRAGMNNLLVPRGRVIVYFQFDTSGLCRPYLNSRLCEGPNGQDLIDILNTLTGARRPIYLHFARVNTILYGNLRQAEGADNSYYYPATGGRMLYMDDNSRAFPAELTDVGGGRRLATLTGNDFGDRNRARVERIIRRAVGTIHLIPTTGRSRSYDYGIGHPWSPIELTRGEEP